ncbi:tetratricopeptide repeat protein 33-like [Fagus crenata]
MKLTWKNNNKSSKKRSLAATSILRNLPFEHQLDHDEEATTTTSNSNSNTQLNSQELASLDSSDSSNAKKLALSFQAQGDKLAEDGKFREALGKWETALTLMPESAVLNEQKAQVLLEIGDSWNALKAATRAAELEPSWAEAWTTLGRAQLNYGEPDSAIESFDKALAIKPESQEAQDDRRTASHLIKRRKQLHSEGLSSSQNRYVVSDKTKAPELI